MDLQRTWTSRVRAPASQDATRGQVHRGREPPGSRRQVRRGSQGSAERGMDLQNPPALDLPGATRGRVHRDRGLPGPGPQVRRTPQGIRFTGGVNLQGHGARFAGGHKDQLSGAWTSGEWISRSLRLQVRRGPQGVGFTEDADFQGQGPSFAGCHKGSGSQGA